eukprot:TRINITY_DN102_c0_g1_i1.p1 TRINITY_DN102_c0_g1~~TRINITY_DN102_c0_g1_i1.p1  ORF type:complete len:105 (-),score=3.14 TRINITY_DN102_c0_g1_i1:198-512(-)
MATEVAYPNSAFGFRSSFGFDEGETDLAACILVELTQSSIRVCMACGCQNSPTWRTGGVLPGGKKRRLCNACGLRWVRNSSSSSNNSSPTHSAPNSPNGASALL